MRKWLELFQLQNVFELRQIHKAGRFVCRSEIAPMAVHARIPSIINDDS